MESANNFPSGEYNILGTVERDGKVYLLLDLGGDSSARIGIKPSASYHSGKDKRGVFLIPASFDDYARFKDECRRITKRIKKERKGGSLKSRYVFPDGEEIGISAKKAVISSFLEKDGFQGFLELMGQSSKPTGNAHNIVKESYVRDFFKRKRGELFKALEGVKRDRYSHDSEWAGLLRKSGISISVIVPTYNEINFERNIQLIGRVKAAGLLSEIIVVDGYSVRHDPSDVLSRLERNGDDVPFTVIRQSGAGKGEAIESGVKYALAQGHDFSIIVDSDNMPALSRVFPDAPVDINIEFFLRSFLRSIIGHIRKAGVDGSRRTFFKASYMRMPQLKKSFGLRFGLVTRIVRDFYKRSIGSSHNLYPLSGEVAFNPRFMLERLSLDKDILKELGLPRKMYCGSNIPGGFCLETVWNSIIDVMGYDICYVSTLLHHHGPVVKSTKTDIGEQIGEVLTGTFAGMLIALTYKGASDKRIHGLLRKIPLEVIRSRRLVLRISGKSISHKDLVHLGRQS
jgi:glycosyltransferase involved in cell wall biosynthesis